MLTPEQELDQLRLLAQIERREFAKFFMAASIASDDQGACPPDKHAAYAVAMANALIIELNKVEGRA